MQWILAAIFALAVGPALAADALDLEEALKLAEARSPQLAAQRAAIDAANELVAPARENPDPKLVAGIENVPVEGGNRWSLTGDSMTMRRLGVMQDFVRGEKRELRSARAEADARREAALLEMQRADLRREVASAWLERKYAERSVALVDALAREAKLQLDVSAAEVASGKTPAAEGIAARALTATLADRRIEAERLARRATAMLSRWIGADAERPLGNAPTLGVSEHHLGLLDANIESHPHLAMYRPMVEAAEAEMRLAAAAKKPDWSVELSYAQRGSAYENMVTLMFRMDLPLFGERRQDPVTRSKEKQLEQVRAQAEDARQRHLADIRAAMVDWESARARLERHRREIVPLAEQREKASLAAYEGGRLDLAGALDARRSVIEARLNALSAELEVARAWTQLAFLLPEGKTP